MTTKTEVKTIDPLEVRRLIDAGYELNLIDVRTPIEFREVHAVGAKNIPLDELKAEELIRDRGENTEPFYFICRSDSRGKKACEAVIAAGCPDVVNVAGGTIAWDDLGLPVVRGKKAMSLERQVRIVAGTIVFTSVALSWLLQQPAIAGVAAFIGAGLVFAGVTDTCGMAMVIAKMPWNKVPDAGTENDGPSCAT